MYKTLEDAKKERARAKRFEPTLIERSLAHVMPKTAQRLHKDRIQFEVKASLGGRLGGYLGARKDRAQTAEWNPGGGSPATDISPDLSSLRERSRDQMRNAAVAVGGLSSDVLHVIGTGLSYTPALSAARLGITEERAREWTEDTKVRFKAWADSTDCHLQRQLDFFSQTELSYRSWLESGDVFILTPMIERDGEMQLALQLIEADRVCNPQRKQNTDTLQDGIELDAATGEPLAIHVAKYHPGDFRAGANHWERIEMRALNGRRNVIHLFDCLRPGQVRGVPWVAPILEILKQLGKWTDAELNAAVISSIYAMFVTMDGESFLDLFNEDAQQTILNQRGNWTGTIDGSGKALNLLPGESAKFETPGRPNPEFDPFWTAMVRQVGMVLGVPYEVLVMHFQSSYTAARGAFMMAWRRWNQRREKMAKGMCQPILELWLANEVSADRIAAPGFYSSKMVRSLWCSSSWTGDGPGSVDPVKDVTAAEKRVALGISTLQDESIAYDGKDWEAKQRQRAIEVKRQRDDGTTPAAAPTALPTPDLPAQPDPNAEDDDDDDEELPRNRARR